MNADSKMIEESGEFFEMEEEEKKEVGSQLVEIVPNEFMDNHLMPAVMRSMPMMEKLIEEIKKREKEAAQREEEMQKNRRKVEASAPPTRTTRSSKKRTREDSEAGTSSKTSSRRKF